jgi:hypothetical protein
MKVLILVSSLALTTSLLAAPSIPLSKQIKSFTVTEISNQDIFEEGLGLKDYRRDYRKRYDLDDETTPRKPTFDERVETTGNVIQAASNMVALGQAVYDLVQKGKPKTTTEYTPVSVVPKDPTTKEIIDPFELEGFSFPVEKSYQAKVVNGSGSEVVSFNYKVMYSHSGSYNGTGKYITGVNIIPGSIKVSYGWDFSSSMMVSGIMNHGTKADPVAGLMLTIKYKMGSWGSAFERNDTIHITGRGEIRNYMMK